MRDASRFVLDVSRTALAQKRGVVLMIRVYLDESGTHRDSQILSIGMAWAKPSVWKAWTKEWERELKIAGPTPVSVYHAVDCNGFHGEFEGWGRTERDNFVKRMLPIIAKHEIHGRMVAIDKKALNSLLKGRPDVMEAIEDPYYMCLIWGLRNAFENVERNSLKRVAFIHEENDYMDRAGREYRRMKAKFPQIASSFAFGAKKEFTPLQCADILAYEANHQFRKEQDVRKPLMLLAPLGDKVAYLNHSADVLPGMVDQLIAAYDERIGEHVKALELQ